MRGNLSVVYKTLLVSFFRTHGTYSDDINDISRLLFAA